MPVTDGRNVRSDSERVVKIVRDQHHRSATRRARVQQRRAHIAPHQRIERRQRLIQQQDGRLGTQRTRQCDAMPLPTTQRVSAVLRHVVDPQSRQPLHRATLRIDLARTAEYEWECNVVDHAQVRKQYRLLMQVHHVALLGRQAGDISSARKDAAGHRWLQPRQRAKQ